MLFRSRNAADAQSRTATERLSQLESANREQVSEKQQHKSKVGSDHSFVVVKWLIEVVLCIG